VKAITSFRACARTLTSELVNECSSRVDHAGMDRARPGDASTLLPIASLRSGRFRNPSHNGSGLSVAQGREGECP
jgi:hypothetical protein